MSEPTNPSPASERDPVRRQRSAGASVRLRDQAGADPSTFGAADDGITDPATSSLADALRITYRLLQYAMIVVFALFLFSGVQQINESERGINLTFGRVVGTDLPPGFRFSYPAPVGELIKVPTANEPLELRKEFFFNLSETEESRMTTDPNGVQALAGGGGDSLDPDVDGMLLLGDGSIAHARVKLTYKRANIVKYAAAINSDNNREQEKKIVTAAVRRGLIQTAATITIDEFLTKQLNPALRNGDERSLDTAARDAAQKILNSLDSGIEIGEFTILYPTPPRRVMPEFNRVTSASTEAKKAIEDANAFRNDKLVEVAGEAAPAILGAIDGYEKALSTSDAAQAKRMLDQIDALLSGERPAGWQGETVPVVTGEVTTILDDARQYRATIASRARSDLAVFNAKRETFRANPRVMVAGEWTSAFGAFLSRPDVQTLLLPPTAERIVMQINRDPRIARRIEQDRNAREYEEAEKERQRRMERSRFQEKFDAETHKVGQ